MAEVRSILFKLDADSSDLRVQAELSAKEIQNLQNALNKAQGELDDTRKSVDRLEQSNDDLTQSLKELQSQSKKTEKNLTFLGKIGQRLSNIFKNFDFAAVFGGIFIFNSLSDAILGFRDVVIEYGSAVSNLQAITGVTNQQLEEFKTIASELSNELKGLANVTETELINAFSLIGSKRPELLKDAEALAEVTKQAAVLSAASPELNLDQASGALATVLNQFDLGASEAERVVNVLAAASQQGAVGIESVASSLERFGGIANTVLQFEGDAVRNVEQVVGLIEVLGQKGLEAADAGTLLRNFFLTTANLADEFNPRIVGLEAALDNLGKQYKNVEEISAIFDRQAAEGVLNLIKNRDAARDLSLAVTDTNVAYEQAATQTNNIQGDLTELSTATINLAQNIGAFLVPAFRVVIQTITSFFNVLQIGVDLIRENGVLIGGLATAYLAYQAVILGTTIAQKGLVASIAASNAVQKAASIVLPVLSAATLAYNTALGASTSVLARARAALIAFNTVLALNPIGLVVGGVALLTAGIIKLYQSVDVVTGSFNAFFSVVGDLFSGRFTGIGERAAKAYSDAFLSESDKLVNELRERELELEAKLDTAETTAEFEQFKDELERTRIQLNLELSEENKRRIESEIKEIEGRFNLIIGDAEIVDPEGFQRLQDLKRVLGEVGEEAEKIKDSNSDPIIPKNSIAALEKELAKLKEQLKATEIGSKRFKQLGDEIERVQKLLDLATGKTAKNAEKERERAAKELERLNKKQLSDQQKFFNEVEKLTEKANDERINLLSGEDKIKAVRDSSLEELEILESNLKKQLEASNITGQAKIDAENDIQNSIKLLRDKAEKTFTESIFKFRDEQAKIEDAFRERSKKETIQEISDEQSRRELFIKQNISNEQEQQKALLQLQIDFAQKRIEFLSLSEDLEDQLTVQSLKEKIEELKGEIDNIETSESSNLFTLLGLTLTPEEQDDVENAVKSIFSSINDIAGLEGDKLLDLLDRIFNEEFDFSTPEGRFDLFVASLNAGLQIVGGVFDKIAEKQKRLTEVINNELDKRIEKQQSAVDEQADLAEQGLDNSLEREQQQLERLRLVRELDSESQIDLESLTNEQLIKLKETQQEKSQKIQRAQQRVDDAEQLSSIFTAIANVIKGFSTIPLVGQILGISASALLVGGFIASKVAARKAVNLYEGTPYVERGDNPRGRDTIPANLNEGEAVIPTKFASRYREFIEPLVKGDESGLFNASLNRFGMPIVTSAKMPKIARSSQNNNNKDVTDRLDRLNSNIKSLKRSIDNKSDFITLPNKGITIEMVNGKTINVFK